MMNFIHVFNEICWFIVFLIYIPFVFYYGIAWFTIYIDSRKELKKLKEEKLKKEQEEFEKWYRKPID